MKENQNTEMNQETPGASISDGLLAAMRKTKEFGPRLREIKEIDVEIERALEHVDLDIAYTPVILVTGQSTGEAIDLYKGRDGRYVCREPLKILTVEETKVARCRYLIQRGREMKPMIDRMKAANA